MNLTELQTEVLKLDPPTRAWLAEVLLRSLDELSEREVETMWLDEAERRERAWDAGEVEGIPAEQVMQRSPNSLPIPNRLRSSEETSGASSSAGSPIAFSTLSAQARSASWQSCTRAGGPSTGGAVLNLTKPDQIASGKPSSVGWGADRRLAGGCPVQPGDLGDRRARPRRTSCSTAPCCRTAGRTSSPPALACPEPLRAGAERDQRAAVIRLCEVPLLGPAGWFPTGS